MWVTPCGTMTLRFLPSRSARSMEPSFEAGDAHVGPVDMTGLDIDDDAVGKVAIGDDGLAVGAVRVHRVNAVAAQFKKK